MRIRNRSLGTAKRSEIALLFFQPMGGTFAEPICSSFLPRLCYLSALCGSDCVQEWRPTYGCNPQVGCQDPRDPNGGRWRSNCGVAGDSGTHFGPTAICRLGGWGDPNGSRDDTRGKA